MHEGAERNHCDCSQLSPLLPVLQINAIWEKIKIYNADIYFHKKIVFWSTCTHPQPQEQNINPTLKDCFIWQTQSRHSSTFGKIGVFLQ